MAFPMSRRHPHFNREHLELWLLENWQIRLKKYLGRRRGRQMPAEQSSNVALRDASFRNYGDYMFSEKFREATKRLVQRAEKANTAIMCAELLYFRMPLHAGL